MLRRTLLRRVSLPQRITSYLSSITVPVHYTAIAKRLHVTDAMKVQRACYQLARRGILQWRGEGFYVLIIPPHKERSHGL